jgi:hypothetical protein
MAQGYRTDLASNEARLLSQTDAAELLNVSRSAVQRATQVRNDGAPELVTAVERGVVSVSAAAQISTLPHEDQTAIVEAGPEVVHEAAKTIREEEGSGNVNTKSINPSDQGRARFARLVARGFGRAIGDFRAHDKAP